MEFLRRCLKGDSVAEAACIHTCELEGRVVYCAALNTKRSSLAS